MQNKEFLGTEPIGRLLRRLAIPTVAAQLINMLYNIVDRIYIGHIPGNGSLALTGVGVCMPLILLVSAFAVLICSGGGPRASIEMGKQNDSGAEKILGACFSAQLLLSAALTAVLLIWHRPLLLLFGASEQTISFAADYMGIYALGTVFVQLTLGMNSFVVAQGFTKVSMTAVLLGAAANIILDPVFIFGFSLGVRGAALATILSQALSCAYILRFLCSPRSRLRLQRKHLAPRPAIVLPCIALGLSMFIMQASESVISMAFNSSLLKYGGDIAVGAMTILSSVMQFALMPVQGISQGAQPILSYNYGAKDAARVRQTFSLLIRICVLYTALIWALVMLFPQLFASIFTPDAALVAFSARALRIYCAVICMFGVQVACQIAFVSLGNAPCSILVAVIRKFILLLPLIYIMPHLVSDPTMGIYLAEPVADFLAVSCTAIIFVLYFRKAMKKLES